MTVKAAAERLEVSASTIYALVAAGRLRCVRIGLGRKGAIRILDEHLEEYLRGSESRPAPAPPPSPPRRGFKHLRPR
ncbi:MAG: helix-turn-helix domain-containing protein [Paludisphaera borealis]|uniref:helix-turn-helix domain-containing protein n=1 Tax=Paludisphaera borealis TaxID=1387353 RepID=UPI00284C6884|nr:helix-turn-helix domain-containing protein [Paludisphaera borealis]MDR3620462.1 helix-turn-helix domain-containing protein [Paludisphaera borealis]